MDSAALEAKLRTTAGVVIADPRAVRRVIKAHREATGLVPHVRCYAIERRALAEVTTDAELGVAIDDLPEEVVLIARPSPREQKRSDRALLQRIWRSVFHARVHRALEQLSARKELEDPVLKRRIGAIGYTEFDEIRGILRHDDQVMPPGDEREVYIEFAALYLEQWFFAPNLLITTFPGLTDHDKVLETLQLDVDPTPLLENGRPPEVQLAAPRPEGTAMPTFSAAPEIAIGGREPRAVNLAAHQSLLRRAEIARAKGNDVRAAVLALQAAGIDDQDLRQSAQRKAREALANLGQRLGQALLGPAPPPQTPPPSWSSTLSLLAERASQERPAMVAVEARLLFQLQRVAVTYERPQRVVDVATSIRSRGKRPIIRDLPATRELRVARQMAETVKKVRNVRLEPAERKILYKLLDWAHHRSEDNVRAALAPRIKRAFQQVGLRPSNGAERLARDKVAQELVDRALDKGFLSFDALRDALSRNQIKLDDLRGVGELKEGDALLRADAALELELDGVYRRGDFYLRGLQKVSSLPFGTRAGRALTLMLLLPLGASWLVLSGTSHILEPVLGWFDLPPVHLLTPVSFTVCALVILAAIHSQAFRTFAREVFELVAVILAWVFLRIPRFIFGSPVVRRWLARPAVRFVTRRVILPAAIGAGVWALDPFASLAWWVPIAVGAGCFLVSSAIMSSRLGAMLEDFVVDQLAPTWQVISRQWLPGLFRLISRFFAALMDLLERGIYRIDELLRFHEGQSVVALVLKGAATFVWGIVAYVVRLYVTLLIEPEINPLKHFPVVTVAHKVMIPVYAPLLGAMTTALSPFGPFIANTFAGVTVFLVPSVFGFLAWELKENYKLYRATRPDRLPPAPVGPHGETMHGLLVVGLHSGTLPKLYERLRRAAMREDEAALSPLASKKGSVHGPGGLSRFRAGIADVARRVRRFVDRELLTLLHRCPRWRHGPVDIARVDLSSNRIRVQLACPALSPDLCEITIEELSGYVVAGMPRAGFVASLQETDGLGTRLFENALAGFYQRAEVDLVREQIEAELPQNVHYDITDEGLVVWPDRDFRLELVYPLGRAEGRIVSPQVRGDDPELPPRVLDTRRMFYREQDISWLSWVSAWAAASREQVEVPRLLRGVSLLPRRDDLAPPGAASSQRTGRTRYEKTLQVSLHGSPAGATPTPSHTPDEPVVEASPAEATALPPVEPTDGPHGTDVLQTHHEG